MRVHPEYLAGQGIDPARGRTTGSGSDRLEDIAAWERHLGALGTRVVKFFLHVSREEQRERFLARAERGGQALEVLAPGTSPSARTGTTTRTPTRRRCARRAPSDAPWYVIPADHKWLMRTAVASIIVHHLEDLDPRYPEPSDEDRAAMDTAVEQLKAEDD